MSDKLQSGVKAGSVDVSLPILLRSTTDNTEVTGKVYGDMTGSYLRQGGVRVAITMATLASVNSAHSNGGFKEVDATNQPGLYRFDVPDAAFAIGADWVVISLIVAGAYSFQIMFSLTTNVVQSADHTSAISTIDSEVGTVDTVVDGIVTSIAALNDSTAVEIRTEIDSNSTQLAAILEDTDELQSDDIPATLAAIAAYVDELESRLTAVRAGYLDELGATNLPADIDTLLTRLTSARAAYLDAAISSRSSHDAADIKTAIEAAGSHLALILEDTGTTLPGTLSTIDGKVDTVDTVVDAIKAVTDDWIDGGRLDLILDASSTFDPTATLSELPQGALPAEPTWEEAIMALFMEWARNRIEVSGSEKRIYNDAGTCIYKKLISDNSTTFVEAEAVTGP